MSKAQSQAFLPHSFVASFGKSIITTLAGVGAVGLLFFAVIKATLRYPQRRRTMVLQMYSIGFQSLPVVVLTGLAIGMVLGVQLLVTLQAFKGETMTGAMVNFALFSQLGPTLTGLMLAGRVGSSIAAELGTMKVTEQIDALRTMGTDPIAYLVVPRFWACVCLLPFLTAIACAAGVFGSSWLLTAAYDVSSASYWERAIDFNSWWEITTGLVKTCVFGGLDCTGGMPFWAQYEGWCNRCGSLLHRGCGECEHPYPFIKFCHDSHHSNRPGLGLPLLIVES